MDQQEEAIARKMGEGVKSQGVRNALRAVHVMGLQKALTLVSQYESCSVEKTPVQVNESVSIKELTVNKGRKKSVEVILKTSGGMPSRGNP